MDERELVRRFNQTSTEAELDKLYRTLSKHTHPDLTGKDGEDFRVLTSHYRSAKERFRSGDPSGEENPQTPAQNQSPQQTSASTTTAAQNKQPEFDPRAILRELGYRTELGSRASLYLSLYRYQAAGLSNRKVRQQASLRRRNDLIIQTVYHWAQAYSPAFGQIFSRYVEGVLDGMRPTAFLKAGTESRRHLEEGLGHFIRYQEEGKPVTAGLARRSLENAIDTIEVYHLDNDAVRDFSAWLLAELDLPPLKLNT